MAKSGVSGISNINKNIKALNRKIQSATSEGLSMAGYELLTDSRVLVPVDTGAMIQSGAVKRKAKYRIEVGYYTDYALKQHEILYYRHPKGGQAKFLTTPLQNNANRYRDIVINKIKGYI